MKYRLPTRNVHRHRGFVSVIVMLFLASVVMFILAKSLTMSGSKSLESQEQFDGVAALGLAESGLEAGLATLTSAINLNDSTFGSSCGTLASSNSFSLGRGTFQYVPSPTPATSSMCPIRVVGSVNKASRTLESQINLKTQIGDGNFGRSPSLTLKNPYNVPAVAVFNLAWLLKRSSGHSTTGNSTTAAVSSACSGCIARWNLTSSGGGNNAVGSLGTTLPVLAGDTVTFSETLSDDRNYVQVGVILGGAAGTPSYIGSFADKQETGNTSSAVTTTGKIPTGEPSTGSGWCSGADTLVLGLSGVGPYQASPPPPPYDFSAAMTSVTFNTNSAVNTAIPMDWVSHYPNTDGTSPNTTGDVYSEIWWTYNYYLKLNVSSVSGTTINLATPLSTAQMEYLNSTDSVNKPKPILKVYSGTGQLQAATRVASAPTTTTVTIDKAPTVAPVSGSVLCGGICALFNTPASSGATTTLTISRTNSAATAQQYMGGMACFSGVDKSKVKRVGSSGLTLRLWHEVLSGE